MVVRPTLELAPGARAAEERLLERVRAHRDGVRADPGLLARPLRIVVPSRSLREHVSERIATELGAVAGVAVQTLFGVASLVLENAGEREDGADLLVEVLARRLAAEEPPLRDVFDELRDGYRSVAGAVRDLLDAGFEAGHAEPALERLAETTLPAPERRRAEAVVRTAGRVAEELARRQTGGRAELLRRARELYAADPELALPSHAIVIHGFADATGRATDLLEELVRRGPGLVLLPHPGDPEDLAAADLGCRFTARLRERLEGVTGAVSEPERAPAGALRAAFFRAPGPSAEVREVGRRIRADLADGVRPERIGVLARDLGGHGLALRRELDRLGVPASAQRLRAPVDGAGRRIHAFLELLESRDSTPADRWLDACARVELPRGAEGEVRPGPVPATLRLALRVVGAGRLAQVADYDFAARLGKRDALSLPVSAGIAAEPAADGAEGDRSLPAAAGRRFHARRLAASGEQLRALAGEASALVRDLGAWPERAALAEHLDFLAGLARERLGWRPGDGAAARTRSALEALRGAFPGEVLGREELLVLVRRALAPAAAPPFVDGGPVAGGGVRLLDAMEARGRTFDRLYVLDLGRDTFPRVVREDPLLGEEARRALIDVVPDVPLPSRGRAEERHLFAWLVSSANAVTLSWQATDEDGKARVVSPLVERLVPGSAESVELVPPSRPRTRAEVETRGPWTVLEHAVAAGLVHGRAGLEERLGAALREDAAARTTPSEIAPATGELATGELARVRARLVEAFDEARRRPLGIAPWLGFLGPQDVAGLRPDPREEPQFVTHFEGLATCAWQSVLRKFLRVEESPDPLDALPGLDKRLLGNVVHGVAERLALDALGEADTRRAERLLADSCDRVGVASRWPDDAALQELTESVARRAIRLERDPAPGLVRAVAACARPLLESLREIDRGAVGELLVGAEAFGSASFELASGGELEVCFFVDRIERREDGEVVLTDFKTGATKKPNAVAKQGPAQGTFLQSVAYARAAQDLGHVARGRYLYLKADPDKKEVAEVVVPADEERLDLVGRALETLLGVWVEGAFVPRLETAKGTEPEACEWCEVRQACLRGDSGARSAFGQLTRGEAGEAGELGASQPVLAAYGELLSRGKGKKGGRA